MHSRLIAFAETPVERQRKVAAEIVNAESNFGAESLEITSSQEDGLTLVAALRESPSRPMTAMLAR